MGILRTGENLKSESPGNRFLTYYYVSENRAKLQCYGFLSIIKPLYLKHCGLDCLSLGQMLIDKKIEGVSRVDSTARFSKVKE